MSNFDPTQRLLRAVIDGYPYNPGDSDLDNEQPIHVKMTLGDYRLARALRTPEADGPVVHERVFDGIKSVHGSNCECYFCEAWRI